MGEKEYPSDLTLPDINNRIYGIDEFQMYTFKVKPCSRAYSYDWIECPFVHPAQYRTRLCRDEVGCNRKVCFFAHKPEELCSVNPTAASVAVGMLLSSPRSPKMGVSSLDMATALMMLQQSTPVSPMSPSSQTSAWMNAPSVQSPVLQLPNSRLKSTLSARDIDRELDLLELESYQKKLLDEISGANWKGGSLTSYSDILGTSAAVGLQMNQSLLSSYGSSLPSSPTVNTSSYGELRATQSAQMISKGGVEGGRLPQDESRARGLQRSCSSPLLLP